MSGIPQILLSRLRQAFMKCDEFHNPSQLYAIFRSEELRPWQTGLPSANNLGARVDITINYLVDQHRTTGESALVLLLRVLGGRYDPMDKRHDLLLRLADQLEWLRERPTPEAITIAQEANPEAVQMLSIVDAEKMLTCARSVARVEVPRFLNGERSGGSSGTGWLVAPGLVLTCWHVIEVRKALEPSIAPADLQKQIDHSLFTFDYTVAGKGLQYKVITLEYPIIGAQILDYALLRLADRQDIPLRDRGYLQLDIDAPLTDQTSLYIIQHPLGQHQQVAGDVFKRLSPMTGRILYKTPTEPGTSGAPVFNRVNWRVVALHNGENEPEQLREGTLLKAILEDLQENRPDLYEEVMIAQEE